jgi:hypothetical protein
VRRSGQSSKRANAGERSVDWCVRLPERPDHIIIVANLMGKWFACSAGLSTWPAAVAMDGPSSPTYRCTPSSSPTAWYDACVNWATAQGPRESERACSALLVLARGQGPTQRDLASASAYHRRSSTACCSSPRPRWSGERRQARSFLPWVTKAAGTPSCDGGVREDMQALWQRGCTILVRTKGSFRSKTIYEKYSNEFCGIYTEH